MPAGADFDTHRNKLIRQGWSDYANGVKEDACQYQHRGSPERRFWLIGWERARRDFLMGPEKIIDAEADNDTSS